MQLSIFSCFRSNFVALHKLKQKQNIRQNMLYKGQLPEYYHSEGSNKADIQHSNSVIFVLLYLH